MTATTPCAGFYSPITGGADVRGLKLIALSEGRVCSQARSTHMVLPRKGMMTETTFKAGGVAYLRATGERVQIQAVLPKAPEDKHQWYQIGTCGAFESMPVPESSLSTVLEASSGAQDD